MEAKKTSIGELKTKSQQKRFAKLISYATIYQQGADWDGDVLSESKKYASNRLKALKFPDGWQLIGSYCELKTWFLKNNTKATHE